MAAAASCLLESRNTLGTGTLSLVCIQRLRRKCHVVRVTPRVVIVWLSFKQVVSLDTTTVLEISQFISHRKRQHSWDILTINQNRCTNFSNLFWNETLRISDSSQSIVRSFSLHTQQWYMSYSFVDSFRAGSGSRSEAVYKPVWHIPLLCVQRKTPDDGQRNCPKHVQFHSKIN
jgi:hypothetical protein